MYHLTLQPEAGMVGVRGPSGKGHMMLATHLPPPCGAAPFQPHLSQANDRCNGKLPFCYASCVKAGPVAADARHEQRIPFNLPRVIPVSTIIPVICIFARAMISCLFEDCVGDHAVYVLSAAA